MRESSLIIILSIVLASFIIDSCNGIKCYVCNSNRDPRCGDPFDPSTIELADCGQIATGMPGHNATLCRKQYIRASLGGKVDRRIVRGCGYLPDAKRGEEEEDVDDKAILAAGGRCFTRAGTFEVMVTYCSCNKEACNSGPKISATSLGFLAQIVMGLIYNFHP